MSEAVAFETKSDFAYRTVRDRILSGELPPGAVIQQRELAADLRISTTPLREGMRRLHSEGLVELDSHRDARVSLLRPEEARDLLELRGSLDPLAAALAAQRRTRDDVQALQAALDDLLPLPSPPSLDELGRHRRYHQAIYRASHNDLLIETLDKLWDKADRYRMLALRSDPGSASRSAKAEEHRLLVAHIVDRDASAAAELMQRHINTSHGVAAMAQLATPDAGQRPRS